MHWEKIFISYDTHDEELVTKITDSLTRIGLEPFKVPDHISVNADLVDKVIEAIKDSNCFVPIITQTSIKSQWVNQEIGYAHSREELAIFPVVEKGLQIKGFIHQTKENIQLDVENPEDAIYYLIHFLRTYIDRNFTVIKKIYITCKMCTRKYDHAIPSQENITKAIHGDSVIPTICKGCKNLNNLSPKTFEIKDHHKISS